MVKVWSYKKDQIDLIFEPSDTGKLTFNASAQQTALFLDARISRPSQNTATFFPDIWNSKVAGLEMVSASDRLIRLTFLNRSEELLFMPYSSRPNLFLVRDGIIVSAFKDPAGQTGKPAPRPYVIPPSRPDASPTLSGEPPQSSAVLHSPSEYRSPHQYDPDADVKRQEDDNRSTREKILAVDRQFPRKLLADVIDTCNLDPLSDRDIEKKTLEIRSLLLNPAQVAITREGHLSLLPASFLSHPPERVFSTVNEAVKTLFLSGSRERRLLPRKKDLEKKLSRRLAGWQKQMEQFEKKEDRLIKADRYEHFGHLLMSQPMPGEVTQVDHIRLADWNENGRETEIPVKPGLTLIDQAKKYYDRAAGIRKEVALSEWKERELAERMEETARILNELEKISHPSELDKWLKNQEEQLRKLGLNSSDKQQEARPYRLIPLGVYEVWIGKNAKSNDEMLKLSHKEDIWMHVRGASGSHLIIRYKGQTGWPEKILLMKAAAWAAAWSRQAGSSLVPVMMAKRKHVRKPKGALPGQVTVTNERVEMVKPQKPDIADS